MSADVSVCTSCGASHAEASKFCTTCGAPMNLAAAQPADSGSTARLPALQRPQPEGAASSVAAPAIPPTVALPGVAAGAAGAARTAPPPIAPTRPRTKPPTRLVLVIGIAAALALLIAALGRTFLPGQSAIGGQQVDRMIVRSSDGETIKLSLMNSDGSNAVTLVEGPTESVLSMSGIDVRRVNADTDVTSYRSDFFLSNVPGATILGSQQRIILWHATDDGVEVRATNLDGGNQITLGTVELLGRLVIPEQGDRVLVIDETADGARLRVVTLGGQETEIIAEAPSVNATISSDGRHIAYWVSDENRLASLWVTDGSGPGEPVARELRNVDATFSADSSHLFVNRVTDSGTSFIATEATGENSVVLSRNGSGSGEVAQGRLVYSITSNGATSLFSSDLRGDDRVEFVRDADSLGWRLTPGRDRVIFTQVRNGRASFRVADLRNEREQDLDRSEGGLSWFPLTNGRLLLIRPTFSGQASISTMAMDGSDEVVLDRNIIVHSFDNHGDAIVVAGQIEGRSAVYLYRGEEATLIDDEADGYDRVAFTPGGQIVYTALYRSGPVTYIVDQQGKQRELIVEGDDVVASGF